MTLSSPEAATQADGEPFAIAVDLSSTGSLQIIDAFSKHPRAIIKAAK
jgi:hypothetical protein